MVRDRRLNLRFALTDDELDALRLSLVEVRATALQRLRDIEVTPPVDAPPTLVIRRKARYRHQVSASRQVLLALDEAEAESR